jgi:hypothetical protein
MSEKQEFKASARVRVTVEVMNLGPYVAECKAEYIHDRAASEAKQSLQTPDADRWFPCSILQPTHFLPLPPAPEVRK